MNKFNDNKMRVVWLACCSIMLLTAANYQPVARAQGIKGGSSSAAVSNNAISQPATTGNSLSSTFLSMFNQLTPIQQQQFIRQMSSSNRRVFQQMLPQSVAYNFEESAGGTSSGFTSVPFGSKSAAFKSSNLQSSALSPVQQAQFFKKESRVVSQPQIINTPASSSFFRQVSNQVQQPQTITIPSSNSNEFQATKTAFVQPQMQSFFNRVQQVQQVAQPVVLPSQEQTFRRVQSFSSQPLQPVQTESGFSQQVVQQQVQPVTTGSSFNSLRQQSNSQTTQPQQLGVSQFSGSSSSNLAGGTGGTFNNQFGPNAFEASSDFQQEKVDATGQLIGGTGRGGFSSSSFVQQQQQQPGIIETNNFSGVSGFESADAQQRNLPDDFNGLTAASINDKWYIMKPVENPGALGLGNAAASNMRQVPLSRLVEAVRSSTPSASSTEPATVSSTSSSTSSKKREIETRSSLNESENEESS